MPEQQGKQVGGQLPGRHDYRNTSIKVNPRMPSPKEPKIADFELGEETETR